MDKEEREEAAPEAPTDPKEQMRLALERKYSKEKAGESHTGPSTFRASRAASGWTTEGHGSTAEGQSDADGSKFENYHEAAQVYDSLRYAGGVEVTLGAFAGGTSAPLHRQRVLDVGCGTGNYAAAVAPHVAEIACFDGNASQLDRLTRHDSTVARRPPPCRHLNID